MKKEEEALEVSTGDGGSVLLSDKDIQDMLKQAMREAGYKTVIMPDGTEVPL